MRNPRKTATMTITVVVEAVQKLHDSLAEGHYYGLLLESRSVM